LFTGLIEDRGIVVSSSGGRLEVRTFMAEDVSTGESVAVDGACLTVTGRTDGRISFLCSRETLSRTVIAGYIPGMSVNLERPLKVSERLHGHIVTGHVDEVASILRIRREGGFMTAWISCSREGAELLVPKGSVAVNGISLTVVSLETGRFSVALIPETLSGTNAGGWKPGAGVNLEFDIVGKYVLKRVKKVEGSAGFRKYLEEL